MRKLPNIHPGEVLLEEFLTPMGISQNALARSIGVPPRRVNEIVLGKRAITADTALRLAHYFGTSERFWMALQASYELEEVRNKLGGRLKELGRAPVRIQRADAVRAKLASLELSEQDVSDAVTLARKSTRLERDVAAPKADRAKLARELKAFTNQLPYVDHRIGDRYKRKGVK
jgi:addiction module HigA family antidote